MLALLNCRLKITMLIKFFQCTCFRRPCTKSQRRRRDNSLRFPRYPYTGNRRLLASLVSWQRHRPVSDSVLRFILRLSILTVLATSTSMDSGPMASRRVLFASPRKRRALKSLLLELTAALIPRNSCAARQAKHWTQPRRYANNCKEVFGVSFSFLELKASIDVSKCPYDIRQIVNWCRRFLYYLTISLF